MRKTGGKKNYGWGSKAGYAGIMALKHHLGQKHGSLRSHIYRWTIFARYLNESGLRDTRLVTTDTLLAYAMTLQTRIEAGQLSRSYAVNLISTVNVTMSLLRGESSIRISPKLILGPRTRIRTTPPAGMNRAIVAAAAQYIADRTAPKEASVIHLAREAGLRLREACLMDIDEALIQAERGKMRIIRGTKGGYGRNMQRWIPVRDSLIDALRRANEVRGESKCLVPPNKTLKQFTDSVHYFWNLARTNYDLRKIHDLRAAYACDRYQQITGYPAPVFSKGKVLATQSADLRAREIISAELGHRRIDIIGAYIGGRS